MLSVKKMLKMRSIKLSVCLAVLVSILSPLMEVSVSAQTPTLFANEFTDFPHHGDGYDGIGVCREDRIERGRTVGNLRWTGPEPNILAQLPISDGTIYMGSTNGYKHHSLVFQSQVRDIEAPFMEMILPIDLSVAADDEGVVSGIRLPVVEFDTASEEYEIVGDKPLLLPILPISAGGQRTIEAQRYDLVQRAARAELFKTTAPGSATSGTLTGPIPSSRAQTAVVGPRGCNIGGWYEMMLYQARCIRWFKLNCICDYGKTFRKGSAEAWVLLKGGKPYSTVSPYLTDNDGTTWSTRGGYKVMPLAWRGTASPYYAPNATPGSHLWDKDADGVQDVGYGGLSEAKPGDLMIYDEDLTTLSSDEVDASGDPLVLNARYRRHVAYVESVFRKSDNKSPVRWITVNEWNYGKNQDSCGNTDRWRTKTTRRIAKSTIDVPNTQPCDNPDWTECYDRNWSRIKLYRPSLDIASVSRPICDPSVLPKRITHANLDAAGVPSLDEARSMSPVELLNNNAWKRFQINSFDAQEVAIAIARTRGLCDPPFPRGNVPSPAQIQLSLKPSAASMAFANNSPSATDVPKNMPESDDVPPWAGPGSGGVAVPSTSSEGFTFTDLCGLMGGTGGSVCDIVLGCITTEECAITDCTDDFTTAGCSGLCSADPDNKLCAAIDCKTTPGRACCALFDIPECCALFELSDEIFRCLEDISFACCAILDTTLVEGGQALADQCSALGDCATNRDATCCELFPDAAADCSAILGCVTSFANSYSGMSSMSGFRSTVAGGKLDACCELYPHENACEAARCIAKPEVECCTLIPGAQDCVEMINCAASPSVACCDDFPDNDICRYYSCTQNPTSECCSDSVNLASPGCIALTQCAIIPTSACCSTYSAENLLSCTALGCYTTPGEACCKLVPQIDECKALASCIFQPTASCCSLIPTQPACVDFVNCISTPTAECCTRFTGIGPVCNVIVDCMINPTVACCTTLGANAGEMCKKVILCKSGTSTSIECCTLFPTSRPDCVARLACQLTPTPTCCSTFKKTPSCILLNNCSSTPSFACCLLAPSITACIPYTACVDGPTDACCASLGGDSRQCDLLNSCVINPDVQCCTKIFPDHPICKLFNHTKRRANGSNVCN
jgi:hypothetical protein